MGQHTIIIGGGLSGLTLAYLLSKQGLTYTLLEASPRLGGRIQTVKGTLATPMELGATWFSDAHPKLMALLEELGLQKFPQFSSGISLFQTKSFEPPQEFYVPEAETPSYRIGGGTEQLITALHQKLTPNTLKLNHRVISISEGDKSLRVTTAHGKHFEGDKVILCLPPQLAGTLKFSPKLPQDIAQLLPTVQTWMAGSIKFTLEYDTPFWRKKGYSGMLYSHTGIVVEMYDHTNLEQDTFGFTGFLSGAAASYTQAVRKKLVLQQLTALLGKEAAAPVTYFDKVWTDECISGSNQVIQVPHQNNGHPLLQQAYLNGKLYFSGTECALEFPGYMEGAIRSAQSVYKNIVK